MTVWGDCAVTENDDGTWTYSPNRKPISFGGIVDPATTGAMFIIESAKGYLSALGTEDATSFPTVGTVRDRYRVYRIVGTKCVIQYFSTTPWNPVGVAICDPAAYDVMSNAPVCRSCSPLLTTRIKQTTAPPRAGLSCKEM